jgi:hypothetical protein
LRSEAEEEALAKKEAKRAKVAEESPFNDMAACVCGSHDFLNLSSRGGDNSGFTLPSGKTVDGYLPDFGLPDHDPDGLHITLCIECGRLQGFDKAMTKAAIDREEERDSDPEE